MRQRIFICGITIDRFLEARKILLQGLVDGILLLAKLFELEGDVSFQHVVHLFKSIQLSLHASNLLTNYSKWCLQTLNNVVNLTEPLSSV